jgi:molybdenum-dependent DNA-binding transcriptional regulator ModE
MEPSVRTGGRQAYTAAVTDLWERVGAALTRLERIAESPADVLVEEHSDELPHLQYSLHAGAELAVGIEPPPTAEDLHDELVSALTEARDATAEVAYAVEVDEADGVEPLLPEWRGSLFRVRLARLRALERTNALAAEPTVTSRRRRRTDQQGSSLTAIVATILILGGAFLFTAGAVLVAWPVWAAGIALFAGGFILYRP